MYRNIFKRNDGFIIRNRGVYFDRKKINTMDETEQFFDEKEKQNKKLKYFVNFDLSEENQYEGKEFELPEIKKKQNNIVRVIQENYNKLKNSLF